MLPVRAAGGRPCMVPGMRGLVAPGGQQWLPSSRRGSPPPWGALPRARSTVRLYDAGAAGRRHPDEASRGRRSPRAGAGGQRPGLALPGNRGWHGPRSGRGERAGCSGGQSGAACAHARRPAKETSEALEAPGSARRQRAESAAPECGPRRPEGTQETSARRRKPAGGLPARGRPGGRRGRGDDGGGRGRAGVRSDAPGRSFQGGGPGIARVGRRCGGAPGAPRGAPPSRSGGGRSSA